MENELTNTTSLYVKLLDFCVGNITKLSLGINGLDRFLQQNVSTQDLKKQAQFFRSRCANNHNTINKLFDANFTSLEYKPLSDLKLDTLDYTKPFIINFNFALKSMIKRKSTFFFFHKKLRCD